MAKIKKQHLNAVREYIRRADLIAKLSAEQERANKKLKAAYGNGLFEGDGLTLSLSVQKIEIADSKALRASKFWDRFSRRVTKRVLCAYQTKTKVAK